MMLNAELLVDETHHSSNNKQLIIFKICIIMITLSCIINTIFNSLTYVVLYKTIVYLHSYNVTITDVNSIIHNTYDLENCISNFLAPVCAL